jgi:hypothetical protein
MTVRIRPPASELPAEPEALAGPEAPAPAAETAATAVMPAPSAAIHGRFLPRAVWEAPVVEAAQVRPAARVPAGHPAAPVGVGGFWRVKAVRAVTVASGAPGAGVPAAVTAATAEPAAPLRVTTSRSTAPGVQPATAVPEEPAAKAEAEAQEVPAEAVAYWADQVPPARPPEVRAAWAARAVRPALQVRAVPLAPREKPARLAPRAALEPRARSDTRDSGGLQPCSDEVMLSVPAYGRILFVM